jgi:hypothetical protein
LKELSGPCRRYLILAKYKSNCLKSKEFSEDNLFSSEKIVRDFVRGKAFVSALPLLLSRGSYRQRTTPPPFPFLVVFEVGIGMGKGDGNWPDFRTRRTSKARSPAGDTSGAWDSGGEQRGGNEPGFESKKDG